MKEKKIEAVMLDRRCIKMKKIIFLFILLVFSSGCATLGEECYYHIYKKEYYKRKYVNGEYVGDVKCNIKPR